MNKPKNEDLISLILQGKYRFKVGKHHIPFLFFVILTSPNPSESNRGETSTRAEEEAEQASGEDEIREDHI